MASSCAVPAQDGNSAVGYIVVTGVWHIAECDHYFALSALTAMWSLTSFYASVGDTTVRPLLEATARGFCVP